MICAIDALVGPTSHTMIVWAIESLAVAVGAAIVVGFLTPVASAAATVAYLLIGGWPSLLRGANNHISALTVFDLAAISGALVFLGPGAFSLDARLFGRREIIIPDGRVQPIDDSQENSTRH